MNLVSHRDYCKRPSGWYEGASFFLWVMCAEESVLKDFTDDALIISAGSFFQNGTARMPKAYWRRRVQHLC